MLSFLEKNLAVLRTRFPTLEKKYFNANNVNNAYNTSNGYNSNQYNTEYNAEYNIEVLPAASGSPTLKINNFFAHSARDPVREARRLVSYALNTGGEKAGTEKDGAIVIMGFGLGYTAEAAASLCPDSLIIVIENDIRLFWAALRCRDFSNFFLNHKVILLIEPDAAEITVNLNCAKKVLAVIENKALLSAANNITANNIYENVRAALDNWQKKDDVNVAGIRRFGLRWLRNLSHNLEAYCKNPGVSLLTELARERFDFPVFVCAAGPSLDGLKPYLAEIYKRAVVVSVDTAAAFLTQNGAVPDFIVTGDPQYWNSRHLDYADFSRSILIAEPSVYPASLRRAGEFFLCGSMLPQGRFFESYAGAKGVLGSGGSVATSAWDFARQLVKPRRNADGASKGAGGIAKGAGGKREDGENGGGENAVYIGALDLAYPDLKTHFKGAFFEERALFTQNRFCSAEGASFLALHNAYPFYAASVNGGRVLTDKRLSLYAWWFENKLQSGSGQVKTSIISPNGLLIRGAEYCSIDKLLKAKPRRAAIEFQKAAILKEAAASCKKDAARRDQAFRKAKTDFKEGLLRLKQYAESAAKNKETSRGITPFEDVRDGIKESALFLVPELKNSAPGAAYWVEIIKNINLNLKLF